VHSYILTRAHRRWQAATPSSNTAAALERALAYLDDSTREAVLTTATDFQGHTLLHLAVMYGNVGAVITFLRLTRSATPAMDRYTPPRNTLTHKQTNR